MKALLQRVSSASVEADGQVSGNIDTGLVVFFCAMKGDADKDLDYIVNKVAQLRIFDDGQGKMNRSILDIHGSALVIPQFTLAAATRRGNRPSFEEAEVPEKAKDLYEEFVRRLKGRGAHVQTGVFAATMAVSLVNYGPVTIWLDSRA